MSLTLYDYWRSSAAYRVRIALNLKGLAYDSVPVNLLRSEQKSAPYRARNPQGLVPFLASDKGGFSQSLAILEYLNEAYPNPPLLPSSLEARAHARAIAQHIACELHPLGNLRVRQYMERAHLAEAVRKQWVEHWLRDGLASLEAMVKRTSHDGRFCIGGAPGMADICLVPQLYSARRFLPELAAYPTLTAIDAHCTALPAFVAASPEKQKDAA
ncbi:MAG: maleylacetoacetate isomerase [Alphaproteobacteria bacterium]